MKPFKIYPGRRGRPRLPLSDKSLFDRYWKRALDSECWEWIGALFPHGYGAFGNVRGLSHYVHRASWQLYRGQIPAGMFVLHHCDNKRCVNPGHLFLGTQKDNMDDMRAKGRAANMGPRGERARSAKLTEEQVKHIRADTRSGPVIAAEYGIQKSAINKVRRRATWAHVE